MEFKAESITAVLWFKNSDGQDHFMSYFSPKEKSPSMRVKTTLLNPTNYCANFRLVNEKGLIIGKFLHASNLLMLYETKNSYSSFRNG